MLLRVLSLLVIMVVPAVGIFMLCDGMREVPSSTTSVCHDHGSGAGVSPAMVGSAHMPHARPRRSRRWPAANLTQARLGETDAPTDAPVCSSSARATGSIAFQDTPTHVLAWCLVMFPLMCHCVAIWMEVVHPGLLLLLRLLSLLVVVMVPAVGIFTLCEGRRVTSRSGSSSAPSCCTRPCAHLTVPRALHERLRSVPSERRLIPAGNSGTRDVTARLRVCVKRVLVLFAGPKRKDDIGSCLRNRGCPSDRV